MLSDFISLLKCVFYGRLKDENKCEVEGEVYGDYNYWKCCRRIDRGYFRV